MISKLKMMEVLIVAAIAMVGVGAVVHTLDDAPVDLVILQDGEGMIDPAPGEYSIKKGNEVTLNMTAAEGYLLSMVTVNGVMVPFDDGSITVTIEDSTEIHVYFTTVEVQIPESKEFTYNGESIVAYDPMDPSYTVIGGIEKDAGEYVATLSLRQPGVSHWSDGTVSDKQIQWSIVPRGISDQYFGDIAQQTYTGIGIEPALRPIAPLTVNDYDVTYRDNIAPGVGYADVVAKNNFIGSVTLEFDIVKAQLIVKADDKVITYGDALPELTYDFQGFVADQNVTDLSGSISISCDYSPGDDVGPYDIVVSGMTSDNYDLVYRNGTLTVERFELKREHFIIDTADETYDGSEKTKKVELRGGISFIEEGSEYDVVHKDNVDVGTATIEITGKGNCKGVVTENFTIAAKKVTVHAVHKEKVYGEADPELTVDIQGVVTGDTVAYTIDLAKGDDVGAYLIDVSGERYQGNYEVTFIDDYLVIEPKDITFTSDSKDKVYDGTPLTCDSVKGEDALEFDDEVVFTVTGSQIDQGSSENTFTYRFTNGSESNYIVHTVYGTLIVKKTDSEITVTADSATKVYDGTPLTDSGFTYTGTLADTDRLVVTIEGTITDVLYDGDVISSVDNRVVSVKVMRGDDDVTENYEFGTHVDGKLKVMPRNVVLISDFNEKVYDGTVLKDDHVEVLGDGFVTGEEPTYVVTGSQTDVGSSKNAFTYTFPSDVDERNYVIKCFTGTLTVTKKPVELIIDPTGPFTYDGTERIVSVSFKDGSIIEEDVGNVSCVFAGDSVFEATDAGTYRITVTDLIGDRSDNYMLKDTSVILEWKIVAKSLTPDCELVFDTDRKYVYNAQEQTFEFRVVDSKLGYLDSDDYTVSGNMGKDSKDYTLTITGKGNYSGVIEQAWRIEPYAITVDDFETIVPHVYTGSEIEPEVVPSNGVSESLVNGKDYAVIYENNLDVGTAKAIVTGIPGSNATGTVTLEFSIYHGLTVYVTKDVNGKECNDRLSSFVGNDPLFDTDNVYPNMPSQTVEMSALYEGEHPGMHLGLVIKYLDSDLSIDKEDELAKRIILTVERDGVSYTGSVLDASESVIDLGAITDSDVLTGSDVLTVTLSFPSTGNDNDVMEGSFDFEFGLCLWHSDVQGA